MLSSAKASKGNRTHWCNIRLNDDEFKRLETKFDSSTCGKLSDYVRSVLFDRPVTVKQRNQSMDDFMQELTLLRRELNSLGNNFNQVVKKLNAVPPSGEYRIWLSVSKELQRELLTKVDNIQARIDQFSDKWFQK